MKKLLIGFFLLSFIVLLSGLKTTAQDNTSDKPASDTNEISFSATASGEKGVTLTWEKVDQATTYKVYRADAYLGKTETTSYTDANVADGNYLYKIVAYNKSGTVLASGTQPVEKKGGSVSIGSSSTGSGLSVSEIWLPGVKAKNLSELILSIIKWLLSFAGAFAVLALVYSGIMYIMAGGEMEKTAAARKNIIWAITGVIIVMLAWVIVATVGKILGG